MQPAGSVFRVVTLVLKSSLVCVVRMRYRRGSLTFGTPLPLPASRHYKTRAGDQLPRSRHPSPPGRAIKREFRFPNWGSSLKKAALRSKIAGLLPFPSNWHAECNANLLSSGFERILFDPVPKMCWIVCMNNVLIGRTFYGNGSQTDETVRKYRAKIQAIENRRR